MTWTDMAVIAVVWAVMSVIVAVTAGVDSKAANMMSSKGTTV